MSETKTISDQSVAHNGQTEAWRTGLLFHETAIGTMIRVTW